jgi:hypothetical protein
LKILTVFLAVDVLLIGVHAVLGYAAATGGLGSWPEFWNIGRDSSAAELLNLLKWGIAIFACLAAYVRSRVPILLGLSVLFLICLLDDGLQLHERGSELLIEWWGLFRYFGHRQGIAGELIVWSILGTLALISLVISWRATERPERRQVLPIFVFFGAIVFCAVVLDVMHTMTESRSIIAGVVGMLEDGGEMVFLTLLLSYVWGAIYCETEGSRSF